METPEQMDKRRAQVTWDFVRDDADPSFDELNDEARDAALECAAQWRASDASAGLVSVSLEDLAEVLVGVEHFVSAHGASPHFNGCVERLQGAIRAAQVESADG